jgi:superfamily I DNA/RNA helicase
LASNPTPTGGRVLACFHAIAHSAFSIAKFPTLAGRAAKRKQCFYNPERLPNSRGFPLPRSRLAGYTRPMPTNTLELELEAAVQRVLASKSPKKLVVAGPGAGKTTVFRQLLEAADGDSKTRLVLTFINNLKDDLERGLGDLARVFTLHGYCQYLLHRDTTLRGGLTDGFRCYPGLVSIIKRDWTWLQGSEAPTFVEMMRHLNCSGDHDAFFLKRADFYDAVDFDDSVHRAYQQLAANPELIPKYSLVLIDEFQDFNKMEAGLIDLLADHNAIVITGDDDQALYSQLRGASWDHIRARHAGGDYEIFELPFCMRCPEVIVEAVNDIILEARERKKLDGRIDKPYRYYPPVKGDDSKRFPKIDHVETTVQRDNANYFGRYIEQCINAIPAEEIKEAKEKNELVALIIGSDPYRRQVQNYLVGVGLIEAKTQNALDEREQAFDILSEDPNSNLGWRIILACGDVAIARARFQEADSDNVALAAVIPEPERAAVLQEAATWKATQQAAEQESTSSQEIESVAVTSYEGSKGRSAPYVFLVGLHAGELPVDARNIKDLEICRLLVGLTRTKRKCTILTTDRFAADKFKSPSPFLTWIDPSRVNKIRVNAAYWKKV